MSTEKLFSECLPPQNIDAEQSVLGACLIDSTVLLRIRDLIKPDDFYADRHRIIWEAICRAAQAGPVDLITVEDQLKRPVPGGNGKTLSETVGGLPYLTSLINTVPTTQNTEQYARIVAAKGQIRRLQQAARQIVEACNETDDPSIVLSEFQRTIDAESRCSSRPGLKPIQGHINDYAEQRYQNRRLSNVDWIPSRFADLREKCPYMRREVTILGAPSGTGKTTLAVAEAEFLANLGYYVGFFELEMSDKQIYDKLIALRARLDLRYIRMGSLTEDEWDLYRKHAAALDKLSGLSVNTETTETMSNIRWQCLRLKALQGLDMVIIDFIDRIADTPEKGERYDQLVARLTGMAQAIARECNCHVMILAQIDVRVLGRANPIPTKTDLANAKTNLVAWADNIITALQPGQARGDGKVKPKIYDIPCVDKRWKNVMLLSVAKGRYAPEGYVIPIYAEMNTGYLGALQRPWPWQKGCPEERVGLWDKEADEQHMATMRRLRDELRAQVVDEW